MEKKSNGSAENALTRSEEVLLQYEGMLTTHKRSDTPFNINCDYIEGDVRTGRILNDQKKLEKYGEGPWVKEPDRVSFKTTGGYHCLIRRNMGGGTLCGYVGIPKGHPLHGMHYDDEKLHDCIVHGGLTFSEDRPPNGFSSSVWYFGFDCSHAGDLVPLVNRNFIDVGVSLNPIVDGTYKDVEYVSNQVLLLAGWLMGAALK